MEVSSNDAPKIAVFEAAVPDLIMGKGHLNEAKVLLVGEAKVGKMEGFCELGLIYTKSSLRLWNFLLRNGDWGFNNVG